MIRVRFVGSDSGAGRCFAGETYFPGQVVDLSPYEAHIAIKTGRAVRVEADPSPVEPVPAAVAEHRDRPVRRRR
jgi:hypothetical protein